MKEIYERRSIRKYTDQLVEKEKLVKMLNAAMNAPTAKNRQEWRFLVIQDRQILDAIAEKGVYMQMMKQANAAIVVCGDLEEAVFPEYVYTNCGAAIQNMLLTATEEGLGTCWCAIGPNQDRIDLFKSLIQLDEKILPVACVAIGYPDEEKEANNRYDEKKVQWI